MGHLGWKTRSQELKIEKPCEQSSGHIFDPIIIKLCQNACLVDAWISLNMIYLGWKTRSQELKIEKPCEHSSVTFLTQLSSNLVRMLV